MLSQNLFAQTMTMLFELYEKPQTKPLMDIYYQTLKDMSDNMFKASVDNILKNRVYPTMPKPAEIYVSFSEAAQNLGNVLRRRGNTEEYILEMMIEWDED